MSRILLFIGSLLAVTLLISLGALAMKARSNILFQMEAHKSTPPADEVYYATKSATAYIPTPIETPPESSVLGVSDSTDNAATNISYALPPTPTPWPMPTPLPVSTYTTTSSNAGTCIGQPTVDNSQVYVSPSTTTVGGSSTISVVMNDCNNNVAPVSDQLKVVLTSGDSGTKINGSSSPVTIQTLNGKVSFPVTASTATTVVIKITDTTRGFDVTMPGYKNPTITFSNNSSGNPKCTTAAGVPNSWYSDVYPNPPVSTTTGSQQMLVVIRDCNQSQVSSDTIKVSIASGDPNATINGSSSYSFSVQNGQGNFTVNSNVNGTVTLLVQDTTSNFAVTPPNTTANPTITFNGSTSSSPAPTPPTPSQTATLSPAATPTSTATSSGN